MSTYNSQRNPSPARARHRKKSEGASNYELIWSFARPHLPILLVGVFFGLVGTSMELAMPMATKWVLDTLGKGQSLGGPIAILLGLLALAIVAGFTQAAILGRVAEGIVLDARISLINRFFRAKLEQIQNFTSGELVTRVTSDTVLLREATTSSFLNLVNGTVSLVGTIVLMAVLDVPLLLSTLSALIIIGVFLGALMPHIGRARKRAQGALGEVGGMFEGGMRAIRTVKSSGAEDREIARISDKAQESNRYAVRAVWVSSAVGVVASGGIQLALIAVLGVGAWRVSNGSIEVSTLVAFLLYAFNIVQPVSSLTMAFTEIQSGMAAAERIRETEKLELEDLTGLSSHRPRPFTRSAGPAESRSTSDQLELGRAEQLERSAQSGQSGRLAVPAGRPIETHGELENPAQDSVFSLRNVTAGYANAQRPALRNISMDVPRSGHVALVGPSGAGKTTIFSLLLRFIDPQRGTVEMNGIPYHDLSLNDVRSHIAYVEQETPIINGTIRDNVLFRVVDASDDEVWDALRAVRLDEKISGLPEGLDTPVGSTSLSGGERQRLAIARALVRTPDVLLLDEATAQLDGITEAAIQNVISKAASTGTVITIAHRLSTVLDADQIIVLENGRIRNRGTHHDLLNNDELYHEFITALKISAEEGR